ncbi:hypothetical protein [Aquincola sp. J276]|uniref:hypothetical protein n=1 Tax=Aquincola sp. J276 TaxID=2898432 RepID=UPI002150E577|nr:hypothetical protein [Aquincola sp. J276]MCR5869279.1 hypothetical protein [Aquincola sp. J276]
MAAAIGGGQFEPAVLDLDTRGQPATAIEQPCHQRLLEIGALAGGDLQHDRLGTTARGVTLFHESSLSHGPERTGTARGTACVEPS